MSYLWRRTGLVVREMMEVVGMIEVEVVVMVKMVVVMVEEVVVMMVKMVIVMVMIDSLRMER